jgi:FKBP-type peptidyl-prolyl cis-trans isomerase FklB
MKSVYVVFAGIILVAGQAFGADDALLKSQKDRVSYVIGVSSGNNLRQQSVDIDPDVMMRGLKDGLSGGPTLLTEPEMRAVMTAFQQEMAIKEMGRREAAAERNKKEGDAFLAENKTREGVKTLPSGLQYKVLKEGTGKSPKATDTVVVHYRGTLLSGMDFDSSYLRNEPANIQVDSVIKGWKEALPLMKEGAKWQLVIPPELAYGENGAGPIGPNSVLLFEVELISVVKEAAAPAPAKAGAKSSKPAVKSPKPAAGK